MRAIREAAILVLSAGFLTAGCATAHDTETAGTDAETDTASQSASAASVADTVPEEEEETRTQQRTVAFAEWDEDGDEALSEEEFDSWWEEEQLLAEWDSDGNETLSEEEFTSGLVLRWDSNSDEVLDQDEWNTFAEGLGDEDERGAWSEWDRDGNGELDHSEFQEAFQRYELFAEVDTNDDGVANYEELREWFFETFDTDGDGEISPDEWDALNI